MKKELSLEAKTSIYQLIYVTSLTYVHELVSTKRMKSKKTNISSQNDCVSRTSFCNMPRMASWPIVSAPDPCRWWAHTAAVRVVIRPREWDHSGRNVYFTGCPGGSDWICCSFLLKAVIWSSLGLILEFFLVNSPKWKEALVHTQSTVEVWHYPICPENVFSTIARIYVCNVVLQTMVFCCAYGLLKFRQKKKKTLG